MASGKKKFTNFFSTDLTAYCGQIMNKYRKTSKHWKEGYLVYNMRKIRMISLIVNSEQAVKDRVYLGCHLGCKFIHGCVTLLGKNKILLYI